MAPECTKTPYRLVLGSAAGSAWQTVVLGCVALTFWWCTHCINTPHWLAVLLSRPALLCVPLSPVPLILPFLAQATGVTSGTRATPCCGPSPATRSPGWCASWCGSAQPSTPAWGSAQSRSRRQRSRQRPSCRWAGLRAVLGCGCFFWGMGFYDAGQRLLRCGCNPVHARCWPCHS